MYLVSKNDNAIPCRKRHDAERMPVFRKFNPKKYDASTGRARGSKKQQQQDSVKDQRERSDSPLTVAAVRTNQSINQSVNDSIKRHPPESGM